MHLVSLDEIPSKEDIQEVNTDNLQELLDIFKEMETLCLKESGIGLSAVQVGLPLKMFIVRFGNYFRFFLNMNYIPVDVTETILSLEGCLSIRSPSGQLRHYQVPRYKNIEIEGFEITTTPQPNLQFVKATLNTEYSIVFAHEIDHQNDILISDIGEEVFL